MDTANDVQEGRDVAPISFDRCRREIPLSTAVWREGSDYVEYACGLDCYDQWRNELCDLTALPGFCASEPRAKTEPR
jgi:hypothetical protein